MYRLRPLNMAGRKGLLLIQTTEKCYNIFNNKKAYLGVGCSRVGVFSQREEKKRSWRTDERRRVEKKSREAEGRALNALTLSQGRMSNLSDKNGVS